MNVNDKEIFLAIHKHPEEGFRKLMAAYMQPVYWHIRRMVSVHADAEDATQETFVRIYRSIGQHSETGSLRAWIFRIATNEALRLLGQRAGRTTLSLDDASAEVLALKQDEWFDNSDKLSARLQQAITDRFERSQKILALREKYYKRYSTFLTQKQIQRVYEMERQMMRRLSQKSGKGARGGQGSKQMRQY